MSTSQRRVLNRKPAEIEDLATLNSQFEHQAPDDLLIWGAESFGNEIVLGTGFGPSGVVLIHKVCELKLPIKVFCLDTNLLFKETYALWDKIEDRFEIRIESVSPILTLDGQAKRHGEELWKSNPDKCCHLRKVLPLQKYLSNKKAWITGLRRSQSNIRMGIEKVEWDPENKVYKLNPLADWDQETIWKYIEQHDLPYNPLHDEGYPSIGCIPCTEPSIGENERSGRWKNLEKTECGIHLPSLNKKK